MLREPAIRQFPPAAIRTGNSPEDGAGADDTAGHPAPRIPDSVSGGQTDGAAPDLVLDCAAGGAPPVIADFRPGFDLLTLTLDPDGFGRAPRLAVGPSADGRDGEVRVDGLLLARLAGAPHAGTADVLVELAPGMAT